MIEKKHYSVLVNGIPEHERLIFKLIFSVSQKSKTCINSYALVDPGQQVRADILITSGLEERDAGATPGMSSKTTVIIVDRAPVHDGNTYLARPLVATRVLSLLDKVAERLSEADTSTGGPENRPHASSEAFPGNKHSALGTESSSDSPETFDFNISEDDAYKLAIVQDESLANPANRECDFTAPAITETSQTQTATAGGSAIAASIQTIDGNLTETGGLGNSGAFHGNRPADGLAATGDSEVSNAHGYTNTAGTLPKARRKVLVVDDSASVRKQLELELALFAADVDYAGSAGEALALLNDRRYDVAFLDVVLPDMDGFQICKSIKNTNKNTAVVMLTAKSSAADKVKGSLAGCDAYLVKPVGRQTFQNTALKYLTMTDSAIATDG